MKVKLLYIFLLFYSCSLQTPKILKVWEEKWIFKDDNYFGTNSVFSSQNYNAVWEFGFNESKKYLYDGTNFIQTNVFPNIFISQSEKDILIVSNITIIIENVSFTGKIYFDINILHEVDTLELTYSIFEGTNGNNESTNFIMPKNLRVKLNKF